MSYYYQYVETKESSILTILVTYLQICKTLQIVQKSKYPEKWILAPFRYDWRRCTPVTIQKVAIGRCI